MAIGATGQRDDFHVALEGGSTHDGRGKTAFHCPYCHGYELGRGRIGGLPESQFGTALTSQMSGAPGTTPASYLEGARCERAKALLLDCDLPLKAIAFRCGFTSDEQLRKAFLRRFSLTPRDYRDRFRTTLTAR
ncbi:helix-turn-helix domain-containing protein [Paracoccus denitrificans]|uniref:helix-turn-helix domain-containing protein n=1 Tax=Paracoccus denitrificans TaxID=266 RepID=UPI001E3CC0FF|nr:helix-turn-helix domain-containing protein [Paracoccus denitrificans]UFS64902.1 helix-turn-helix domain-containing protein [Paracoccus denitrificans]